jgi:4-amino-4-deoxy-L-arabinose transferase-like glycosyltransferase
MKGLFNVLPTKTGITILFIGIILFFVIFSAVRVNYIEKSFDEMAVDFHNDWDYYAKHAKDINETGVLMPSVESNYVIPAGFFYNYFLAACIFVFGTNVGAIYFLQSLLLALAIIFVYYFFEDELQANEKPFFILGLFVFACLDVYKYYTFLLLSENLAIVTIPAFLLCFKRGIQQQKTLYFLLAGLLLGVSALTRPTLFPFCIFLVISLPFVLKSKQIKSNNVFGFLILAVGTILLLPLRNYLVTGTIALLPVNGSFSDYMNIANPLSFSETPMDFLGYYFKKVLFCLGFLPILEPLFQYRPHWMLMWLGYVFYLIYFFKRKSEFKLWNFYTHVLILIFYSVVILVAPIQSYGFRMIVPVLFLVYGFAFIGLSRRISAYRQKLS